MTCMRIISVEKTEETSHTLWEDHMEPMSHFSPGANPMFLYPSLMEKGALGKTRERAQQAISESR